MDIPRELARLIRDSSSLRGLLDQAVELVAGRMGVDVCSIYLFDPKDERLWLVASHGFRFEAVGEVSLALSEGLTGHVVRERVGLTVTDAPRDPRYRSFAKTGEEDYHSYLGEPLTVGRRPVGAIVLRTLQSREFTPEEQETLAAIASQLVGLVENARLVGSVHAAGGFGPAHGEELEEWYGAPGPVEVEELGPLKGNPTSPGMALAEAIVIGGDQVPSLTEEQAIDPLVEREHLQEAQARARMELQKIQEFTRQETSEDIALIFSSHLLFLSDEVLVRQLDAAIAGGSTAARAVNAILTGFAEQLGQVSDAYIRERSGDVLELRDRLLMVLSRAEGPLPEVRGHIAVVPSLTASVVVELRARGAVGVVAEHGAPTSHGAILARSFSLPSVAGVSGAMRRIATGDWLALDGTEGTVVLDPDPQIEGAIREAIASERVAAERRGRLRDLKAVTGDGQRVVLLANVGLSADLRLAARHGAEGVGLYRTEIPFLVRRDHPSRAEQTQLYAEAFAALPDRPIVFRTLDLGGDKFLRSAAQTETNPFLGYRSIRLSLDHPDEFLAQIQAIQIAAYGHQAKIMFPLVSQVDEVRYAREYVVEASERLTAEGIPHHDALPLGIMIEVPAAVEIAPVLAREVDFFSIGTNDLTQYALAVDRGNDRVAHLGDPVHPAVLSMIHRTVLAARNAGIEVSVCGEMAGNPLWSLLLVGLGVDRLSMNPGSIPVVKEALRAARHDELCREAKALLDLDGPTEVRAAWTRFVL